MATVKKEEMIKHFAEELQSGNAALFVGAGLSKAAGFVNWKELMREIASEIGLDIDKESDLIAVAQYHVNERQGRDRINRLLIEEFTKDTKLTRNHHLIAALPVQKIWTTNYDDLLETAYREAHRRADVKTSAPNMAQTLPQRDVVIYKMHGDKLQPQDAVLTKEDYETYGDKREVFSTALKGELVERTFLFLGFSFTDPNIDYILGRIRGLLGQNQRSHYCVMKWPEAPKGNTGAEQAQYEYEKRRLELRISDLSRYKIHAVMVNSFDEITGLLEELNRRSHMKHIFVSGSAASYEPFGRERLENFLLRLGREIILRGFNLVSGFGLGVGGTVVLGAWEQIYDQNLPSTRLTMFPFPQKAGQSESAAFYSKYRATMLSNAGIAIFLSGNRASHQNQALLLAPGVLEEFKIAEKLGKIPVPLGATGWAAENIWQTVSATPTAFYGDKDVAGPLKVLGERGHSDDEYLNAIFDLISRVNA